MRRRTGTRVRRATLVVAVLTAGLAGCAEDVDPAPAPPLSGASLVGDPIDIEDHHGDVVLVTAWASWCGPCRDEVPVLNRALEELGHEGLRIVGVNFRDHPDAAQQFVDRHRPTFPSVTDPDGALGVSWGVGALPQSFLVDRDGLVVERLFGPVSAEWIADVVTAEVRG